MKNDFDKLAGNYDELMGEGGDFHHKNTIDPAIYKLAGNVKGKKILDLGCGNGYMARALSKKGAIVTASDISSDIIDLAERRGVNKKIKFLVHDASDLKQYPDNSFDIVIANMMIFYVKNLDKMMSGIARILKPGGKFIFSFSHPFRPLKPYSDWEKGKINNKKILFIKVTGYLNERAETYPSRFNKKVNVTTYYKPLGKYIEILAKHNLLISAMIEPPSKGLLKDWPERLRTSHRIPTFIIISATKIKNYL